MNGGWSSWRNYPTCSTTCGRGLTYKIRWEIQLSEFFSLTTRLHQVEWGGGVKSKLRGERACEMKVWKFVENENAKSKQNFGKKPPKYEKNRQKAQNWHFCDFFWFLKIFLPKILKRGGFWDQGGEPTVSHSLYTRV